MLLGGESRNPEQVYSSVKEYIKDLKKNGLSKEDFLISKKAVYGDAVSSLNSVSSIANSLMDSHFTNRELFSCVTSIYDLKFEDIEEKFADVLDYNNCALSVVR